MPKLSERDKRLIRHLWQRDKAILVDKAIEIHRGVIDADHNTDTSHEGGIIGLMVGSRDHVKTADSFIATFETFLENEVSGTD